MLSRLLLPAREGGGIQTAPTHSYHRAVQKKKNPAALFLLENIVQVVLHLNKQPGREWEQPGYLKRGSPGQTCSTESNPQWRLSSGAGGGRLVSPCAAWSLSPPSMQ